MRFELSNPMSMSRHGVVCLEFSWKEKTTFAIIWITNILYLLNCSLMSANKGILWLLFFSWMLPFSSLSVQHLYLLMTEATSFFVRCFCPLFWHDQIIHSTHIQNKSIYVLYEYLLNIIKHCFVWYKDRVVEHLLSRNFSKMIDVLWK